MSQIWVRHPGKSAYGQLRNRTVTPSQEEKGRCQGMKTDESRRLYVMPPPRIAEGSSAPPPWSTRTRI